MKPKYIVGAVLVALLAAAVLYLYGGGQTPAGQPELKNLSTQSVGEIKNEFNAAKDDVRVLLLLSPTCPICLQGASAFDHILGDVPGKPVRTFVVWEPVLLTDWSSPSTATLGRISHMQAMQFWDRERLISHSMGEHDRHSIVWDYIAVYSGGALWEARPPEPLYSGGPVVHVIDEARSALSRALNEAQVQQVGAK